MIAMRKIHKAKQESSAQGSKTFELVWSERVVRSAVVQAKNEEEARRKFLLGDPEVWGCPEERGSGAIWGTLEIEEVKPCRCKNTALKESRPSVQRSRA